MAKKGSKRRAPKRAAKRVKKKRPAKKTSVRRAGKQPPKKKRLQKRRPKRAAPARRRVLTAAAPELRAEAARARLDLATFNTHGAVDTSGEVQREVGAALRNNPPAIVCFQELFFEEELSGLDAELMGANVDKEIHGDIELGIGDFDSTYQKRVACSRRSIGGAGAGLAIYTSLPFENSRFVAFDGLQIPDAFSVKGVLAVDITLGDFTFTLATTHFNDDENDQVDGRAREANIRTLETLVSAAGMPVLVLGDFNTDSSATSGTDRRLVTELLGMANRPWVEAGLENARVNNLASPVPTLAAGRRSIDYVLASGAGPATISFDTQTYVARNTYSSDHRLVRVTAVIT